MTIFFFQSSATHRSLHSFPTRRSSDLLCTGGCGRVFPFTTNANIKNGDGMALAYRAGAPLKDMERSEEHTSELQSRGHLVCRLLLEKKKKKNKEKIHILA